MKLSRFTLGTVLFAVCALIPFAHGAATDVSVIADSFNSTAAGATVNFKVIVPAGYTGGTTTYPVVYHLHGQGGNQDAEVSQNVTLFNACYTDLTFPRMIMILANGYDDSFYGNPSPLISGKVPVEKTIVGELISVVEDRYRVKPGRNFRAMQGFSMGGQGANLYGHKYPDMFCTVVSYSSGCRDWASMNTDKSGVISGWYANHREHYEPHCSWHWTNVNQVALQNGPKMRMMVGTSDGTSNLRSNNFLLVRNQARLNIPVEFIEPVGVGHDLNQLYSYAYTTGTLGRDTLLFHAKAFVQTATPRFSGTFMKTAQRGLFFSYQAQANNGPITAWNATGLPTGLSIDTSTGLISGTINSGATVGPYFVNLTAANAADTGAATLVLNVETGNPALLLKSQDASVARVGYPFQYRLLLEKPMISDSPTVTYSATNLPSWLSLDTSTGVLSGTPSTAGTFTITFTAANGVTTNNQTHTLFVGTNAAPTVSIAASATVVSKFVRALSVLGSDDWGEPNLTYTWTSTGTTPAPTFTPNGTNTAKRAQAVFARPGTYNLNVRITDQDGLFVDSSVAVTIANFAPTDIALSASSISENSPPGTVIGTLSSTDADLPSDTHSYTLTNDAGGRFAINGNQLVGGATNIDFEAGSQYNATVQSTDASGAQTSKTFTITVTDVPEGLTPVITWANPADIAYTASLTSTQLNATADTPGTFIYTPPLNTVLNAGNNQTLSVQFNPTDTTTYISTTKTVSINVLPLATTVVFAPPVTTIQYGTALNTTDHLAANVPSPIDGSDLAGVFVFTPSAGTVLDVGTQTLNVSFVPTDPNFANASGSAQIQVVKAQPAITWNAPAAILYPAPLSASQLNATANVPGTFVYSPPLATVLAVGNAQTLQCRFTPQDGAHYETVQGSVTIDVLKATPVISWPIPSDIVYGTLLSGTQLNAAAGIPGTYAYTPDAGTTLNAGLNQTLSVVFTPTDTANYSGASKSVGINVLQLTPVVSFQPQVTTFTYGTALNGTSHLFANAHSPLDGADLDGTFTFSSPVGTVLNAGTHTVTATFAPVDPNFTSTGSDTRTFTVTKAPLTIAAVNKTKIAGQPNPVLTATYSGFVNGENAASLDTPLVLSTTALQNSLPGTYPIAASGATDANYTIAFTSGTLTVTNTAPVFSSPGVTFTPAAPTTGQSVQFQAVATDADGQALSFTWNFGDATNGSGTPISHTFTAPGVYAVQCNASDGFGGTMTAAVTVKVTTPAAPPFPGVKINFQPAGSPIPAGYLADTGAVFGSRGNGYNYGWNANNASAARDRNAPASADQRYDTLQHMQIAPNSNALWEIELPNGSYLVTLISGDPSYIDSKYKIQAENTLILSGTPTATKRWISGSAVIAVTDGRLTLRNAAGAANNKICFVDISAAQVVALSREALEDEPADLLPMRVNQLGSALNFTKNGNDSLKLALELPGLAADFNPNGQTLDLDAMGSIVSFTIAKGRGRSGASSVLMKYDTRAAAWKLQVTLSRAKLGEIWVDASLVKETKSASVPFAVAVKINNLIFGGDRTGEYSNKNGKMGKMK